MSRTQIVQFGVAADERLGKQATDQNGGSRATAAASDRHAARLAFQSADEPSADFVRMIAVAVAVACAAQIE